ncbi:hypothetical protein HanIR_Chr13g0645241 [Helianthus annuus]|nr:hypothetical protein HanIR_Chr13g0645241 [Helianthus annuus]
MNCSIVFNFYCEICQMKREIENVIRRMMYGSYIYKVTIPYNYNGGTNHFSFVCINMTTVVHY